MKSATSSASVNFRNLALALTVTTLSLGCGARSTKQAEDAGTTLADSTTTQADATSSPDMLNARPCTIGVDFSKCCPQFEAIAVDDLPKNNPCWRTWPALKPAPDCQMPMCPAICAWPVAPPSRIARAGLDGVCRFADECRDPSDCVMAINYRQCCPCPEALPRPLLDGICVQATQPSAGEMPPADRRRPAPPEAACQPQDCYDLPCVPCADSSAFFTCEKPPGVGPARCIGR
ncbi:MAG: hypothetical protein H6707_17610 [Deltaproteobacteria bacterium]|nr:hypothetical protein [Deltaproteobacteria bacterium]